MSVLGSSLAHLQSAVGDIRGGGRGWSLVAIAGGWSILESLRFVLPALLPAITTDFPISETTAGAAITLLWVTYALMQLPAGVLVHRLRERALLVASVVGGGLVMILYAVSPSFWVFLVATAVFGVAAGTFGPPRDTTLVRLFPGQDGTAFGVVFAAGSLGSALVPPAAAYAAGVVGWRGALGLTAPAFLIAGVAIWWFVPDESPPHAPADGPDAHAPTESTAPDDDRLEPDGGTITAGIGEIARAIATRRVAPAVVAAVLMLFVFQGLTAFLATYLVDVKGLTEATAASLLGALFVSGGITQLIVGGAADRLRHSRVMAAVSAVSVPPLILLPYTGGLAALALVSLFLGVRLSLGPVQNSYIISNLPPDVRGAAWGTIRTLLFVLGAFGSTVVGAMADADLYTEAFLLLAALTLVGGVIFALLPERDPEMRSAESSSGAGQS